MLPGAVSMSVRSNARICGLSQRRAPWATWVTRPRASMTNDAGSPRTGQYWVASRSGSGSRVKVSLAGREN